MLLKSKIYGSGSDNLIVLHGFLGMSDNWKSFGLQMINKGFKVHLIDQRNHGNSFHSKDFNYKILAPLFLCSVIIFVVFFHIVVFVIVRGSRLILAK